MAHLLISCLYQGRRSNRLSSLKRRQKDNDILAVVEYMTVSVQQHGCREGPFKFNSNCQTGFQRRVSFRRVNVTALLLHVSADTSDRLSYEAEGSV